MIQISNRYRTIFLSAVHFHNSSGKKNSHQQLKHPNTEEIPVHCVLCCFLLFVCSQSRWACLLFA